MNGDQKTRKSAQLHLSFPYDWSNPSMDDDVLIINVLERGVFEDICRVSAYFGLDRIKVRASELRNSTTGGTSLARMMDNIAKGFVHAQSR